MIRTYTWNNGRCKLSWVDDTGNPTCTIVDHFREISDYLFLFGGEVYCLDGCDLRNLHTRRLLTQSTEPVGVAHQIRDSSSYYDEVMGRYLLPVTVMIEGDNYYLKSCTSEYVVYGDHMRYDSTASTICIVSYVNDPEDYRDNEWYMDSHLSDHECGDMDVVRIYINTRTHKWQGPGYLKIGGIDDGRMLLTYEYDDSMWCVLYDIYNDHEIGSSYYLGPDNGTDYYRVSFARSNVVQVSCRTDDVFQWWFINLDDGTEYSI